MSLRLFPAKLFEGAKWTRCGPSLPCFLIHSLSSKEAILSCSLAERSTKVYNAKVAESRL